MSTIEWMPSEIMAELPVIAPATNFMAAMAEFPSIAANMAVLDSWAKDSPRLEVQKHAIVRLRETLHRVVNMGKSWASSA